MPPAPRNYVLPGSVSADTETIADTTTVAPGHVSPSPLLGRAAAICTAAFICLLAASPADARTSTTSTSAYRAPDSTASYHAPDSTTSYHAPDSTASYHAPDQAPAPIRTTLYTSVVRWTTTPGRAVTVTLATGDNLHAHAPTSANASGEVTAHLSSFVGADPFVRPGDSIGVWAAGAAPFTRTVPVLSVMLNAAEDEVTGKAPANANLSHEVFSADDTSLASAQAQANAAGDFSFPVDLGPLQLGTYGHLVYTSPTGDRYTARWDLFSAAVELSSPEINGSGTLGSSIQASLTRGAGGVVTSQPALVVREPLWSVTFRRVREEMPVQPLDVISVTLNGMQTLSGIVPDMTGRMDPDTDTVEGRAPADAALRITAEIGDEVHEQSVQADAEGDYRVVFTGVDLKSDTTVYTSLQEGRFTYSVRAVIEQVRAQLYGAAILGQTVPGSPVMAELRAPDGTLLGRDQSSASPGGAFQLQLRSGGNLVASRPSDRLTVQLGDFTVWNTTLPGVSARANPANDTVAGTAVAGSTVIVRQGFGPGAVVIETVAGQDGSYLADFSGAIDVRAGSSGTVDVAVAPGRFVFVGWAAPLVRMALGSADVSGVGPSGREAVVRLRRAGVPIAEGSDVVGFPSADWSVALQAPDGSPGLVQPGDALEVNLGDDALTLGVPDITIAPDTAADKVRGEAPANRPVAVLISRGPSDYMVETTSTASGQYEVDLAGRWDVRAGDSITTDVTLSGGHVASLMIELPALHLQVEDAVLMGRASPNAQVTAGLYGTSLRVLVTTVSDAQGNFTVEFRDEWGAPVFPNENNTVTVEFGQTAIEMTVPVLTAVTDAETDTVHGTAAAGGRLVVDAFAAFGNPPERRMISVRPEADGTWVADFAGILDLRPGGRALVTYEAADGHRTSLERIVPIVNAQAGGNRVHGVASKGANVSAVLQRGTIEAEANATANRQGIYDVRFVDPAGDPITISAGDRVTVDWTGGPTGPGSIEVTVPPMSAQIDLNQRTLAGITTVTRTVEVVVYPPRAEPIPLTTSSGAAGQYVVPLAGGLEALRAGLWAEAAVRDSAGHRIFATAVVPYAEITLGDPQVRGRARPLAPIGLEVLRSAQILGSGFATSDTDGWFAGTLSRAPAAGMEFRLSEPGGRSVSVAIPSLSVRLDAARMLASGVAPAGAGLEVLMYTGPADPFVVNVITGDDGRWQLRESDLPAEAPRLGDLVDLRVRTHIGNGHLLIATLASGDGGMTIYLPSASTP